MPNRIIKESICTSDSIDSLSWFEEVLFYRLIVSCDDYGRFDGRAAVIKNRLFPLKDDLTLGTVKSAIQKLVSADLVITYESMGKPYLYLPTWTAHQNVRAKRSKYPAPDGTCDQMKADDIKCPRNPIQSESISESEIEAYASCAEPETVSTPPAIMLPLNDGTEYPVSQEQCQKWAGLYPAVDVMQQLRNMRGWLESNPTKRKTKRGIARFITGWLAREQDRGGRGNQTAGHAAHRSWVELAEELDRKEGAI